MAALSAMGVDVYTKQTKTVPSFMMPFTNPKHDVDVSGQMHVNGHIEIGLTQVSKSLTKCCGWRNLLPQNWSVSRSTITLPYSVREPQGGARHQGAKTGIAHVEGCILQL